MIVYKKIDDWYIEWRRITTSDTTNDNEWYNEWQRITTSGDEWQRVTPDGNSDSEWQQWVVQRMKTNKSK